MLLTLSAAPGSIEELLIFLTILTGKLAFFSFSMRSFTEMEALVVFNILKY